MLGARAIALYMAFLPLFIAPRRDPGVATMAAMGATIPALSLLHGALLSCGGHWAARSLREDRRLDRWRSRATAASLIGVGVRMGMD